MKKQKASKRSAVTQPKKVASIPATVEEPRCNPPLDRKECIMVAKWEAYDGTWEVLLYSDRARKFYLDWSWADPADVTESEALSWYGQKRALDIDYGDLSAYNPHELLERCARELREWEDVKKHGVEAVEKRRNEAAAEFFGKAGAK